MGQPLACPLPKQIPRLNYGSDKLKKLNEMGIISVCWTRTTPNISLTQEFVDLELPKGWSIKKGSRMIETEGSGYIEYFIVDNNNFIRVAFKGYWSEYSIIGNHGSIDTEIKNGVELYISNK